MNINTSHELFDALAQTLGHFVWQGALLWLTAVALLHAAGLRRAQSRYLAYCTVLFLLAACPVITFTIVRQSDTIKPVPAESAVATSSAVTASVQSGSVELSTQNVGALSRYSADVRTWLRGQAGLVVGAWLLGAGCCGLRLAAGAAWLRSLKGRGIAAPPHVIQCVARLVRRMQFGAAPVVLVVERLPQALASGVLRPVILLPAAWVTQLDSLVLEAVIAHELAHLRRWDLAINWAQRVVEAVLFFHPVVWWCSRRIRAEREMCCDELALGVVDDRLEYAKALADLARATFPAARPPGLPE